MSPQVRGPFREGGPWWERRDWRCRQFRHVPAGGQQHRVRQGVAIRSRSEASPWGGRWPWPPGCAASVATGHTGRGNCQGGKRFPAALLGSSGWFKGSIDMRQSNRRKIKVGLGCTRVSQVWDLKKKTKAGSFYTF